MKKYLAATFMLFSLITVAETELNFSGNLNVKFDEFTEKDGKEWYSMNGNGNIFGTGDWKQSTNDNYNDNTEKFLATLDLNLEAKVNDRVKFYATLESLTENFTGITNGDEVTSGQEASTVRDNDYLFLKDLKVEIDTNIAELTITNSFNYSFNPRVLFIQLEDNDNEPVPYGEGIYAKGKSENYDLQAFMFQSSDYGSEDEQDEYTADYMVYGIDVKKEFSMANLGILAINTHDKSSEVSGDTYGKDMDVQHYALNAELTPFEFISVKGEYITAQYGDDVTQIDDFMSNVLAWYPESYDVSTKEAREDNSIYEASTTIRPFGDLEITAGYKNVGEDYYAVLGNSHQMNYWFGDATFDASEGLGYEKGAYGDISFYIPFIPLDIKNKTTYQDFENTRSALNDNEDTNEKELKTVLEYGDKESLALNASYRLNMQENNGSGTVDKTDLIYNDYNVNGSYKMSMSAKTTNTFAVDLNYYTGDDVLLDQNFSNEKRVKVSSFTEHKLSETVTLKGLYRFGYATEDNDVVQNASGVQNIVKAGVTYTVSADCVIDVFYKYDNYKLDRDATFEELENSVYKKEVEHSWYDGVESWDHSSGESWKESLVESYDGYQTHELCASLTIKF